MFENLGTPELHELYFNVLYFNLPKITISSLKYAIIPDGNFSCPPTFSSEVQVKLSQVLHSKLHFKYVQLDFCFFNDYFLGQFNDSLGRCRMKI